jgi:hypothetical protein
MEEFMHKKLSSRKFWLAQQVVFLSVSVPLLFKHMEISESVTLIAMGVIAGAGTLYGVVNTIDKRLNGGVS